MAIIAANQTEGMLVFLFLGCDEYSGEIVSGRCLFKPDTSVSNEGMTFNQANKFCQVFNGTTIVVDNVEVKEWIQRINAKIHWIWAKVVIFYVDNIILSFPYAFGHFHYQY